MKNKKPDLHSFKVSNDFLNKFTIKENQKLNLWYNEHKNILHLYLKGTSYSDGNIAIIKDKKIISDYKSYEFEAKINKILENQIIVEFYIPIKSTNNIK